MEEGRGESKASSANGQVDAVDRIAELKTGRPRVSRSRRRPLDEDEARRALADSKKLYYRIGEVSELTGVKAHVLRYWETEFRWMAPPKSRSKQRLYRKRDIEFVWLLKRLLWDQRYTIAGARQRIQELGLDEALSRCADAESLDAALLSASGTVAAFAADASGAVPMSPPSASSPTVDSERAAGSESSIIGTDGRGAPATRDWIGLGEALASMQSELLELRGALQQGL